MNRLIDFALRQRLLIGFATIVLLFVGLWSAGRLPIDAVPDVTNVQVQINTSAPALSPVEVERQITLPVELAMAGIPRLAQVRSLSKFGLSQVTVIFEEGTDIYFARQMVQERLQVAREQVSAGAGSPEMGPISTGLGEIFQYSLESELFDATELRTLQDWVVAPILRQVSGVAEVNSFGGFAKQFEIQLRPSALRQFGLTLEEVVQVVADNNLNAGGGYIVQGAEQVVVRGVGRVESVREVGRIVLATREGVPITVDDVATVAIGARVRQGAVTMNGRGEVVTGIVMMRLGENSRAVVAGVKARTAVAQAALPDGVTLVPFYDRADLVDRTIGTVEKNLIEGAALVVAVLFLLLGNMRAALIVALVIPLSMMFALSLMVKAGIAGSLMSLGAIDFGLVVDGSVVVVENTMRHLRDSRPGMTMRDIVARASREVARPVLFGVGIIIVVYLPILTLEGVEGKLFRPMALTVVFALIGSLILTFTLTPVLCSWLLRPGTKEKEPRLVLVLTKWYTVVAQAALARPRLVLGTALLTLGVAAGGAARLGSEFIPRLDEGALAIQVLRLPSVSLEESVRQTGLVERLLRDQFPDEVIDVVSKTGRAEIATDPMGVNISDILVMLTPRREWTRAEQKADLEARMSEVLEDVPGLVFSFSQPIELRVNELIAGVRSDLAVKLYGDDLDTLGGVAERIVERLAVIDGATGFKAQQLAGLPQLELRVIPERLARFGVRGSDVMRAIASIAGVPVSTVFEGQRRFPLVVRVPEEDRSTVMGVTGMLVSTTDGTLMPLRELVESEVREGPAEIGHEDGSRLVIVEGNVRGRDIGGFVSEARDSIAELDLPAGYRIEFGGQFENLERASKRLGIVVPLSLVMIFIMLFAMFESMRLAALVFSGIPFAAVGGVAALLARGMPFSISAGVGFIALFGVAVLNGVVLASYINELQRGGASVSDAVLQGAVTRLRPVLMTASVASLGFLPMALATGSGAEVQRPLATVVIGGLVTSTILTLVVFPVLYQRYGPRRS